MKSVKCQEIIIVFLPLFFWEKIGERNFLLCEDYYVRNYLFLYSLIFPKYLLCLFYGELCREITITWKELSAVSEDTGRQNL